MRYVMLIIATMLVATPLGAQGWRVETTTGFEHVQYLAVESKEANATLSVWCGVDRPSVGIDLAPGVGIFNFTTLDNASATTRERFLPDSTIVSTLWSV